MKRWTLDELREALSALARESGVDAITLTGHASGDEEHVEVVEVLRTASHPHVGWAIQRPAESARWEPEAGNQDLIDRVLGRGEYQP